MSPLFYKQQAEALVFSFQQPRNQLDTKEDPQNNSIKEDLGLLWAPPLCVTVCEHLFVKKLS